MTLKEKAALVAPTLALLALPLVASAHQVSTYQIGSSYYQFVVGSLNEPLVVDDKTGVDITVTKCATSTCAPTKNSDGDMDGPAGTPVSGLDQSLKVTLEAAGQKKTFALSPQYGKPGAYTAPFYSTVATTLAYEVTGTVNGTPIDLTFTCIAEGTPKATLDTTHKQIANGVTQTSVSGGFGCPLEKAGLGFPEQASTMRDLGALASSARMFAVIGIALSVLGLLLSLRRRSA